MNRWAAVSVVLAVTLLAPACADQNPLGPSQRVLHRADMAGAASASAASGVTALTWNVFVGAEVERVLQAQTPDEAVRLATEEWMNVQATNFPARAGVLAAAIAARRPQVVGLEELGLYRMTDRPFEELAMRVVYDFLQFVVDSLRARGLDYRVAAEDRTTDLQVPIIAGFDPSGQPILAGVRFTDRDALLVRADVPYANPRSGVYSAHIPVTIGGTTSGVYQGWSSVEATIAGATYRFVVTHLAGQEVEAIQLAQTQELLALLADESRPTILLGDFNSDVYGADPTRATPTYGMLTAAGYADSWAQPDRGAPGLTCCERADLLNPQRTFDQRIDFIFTRHLPAAAQPVRREVVGDRPGDRTASGLWPSDHAGVAATFFAPPAGGAVVVAAR